jgi:MraZ protein
MLIGQYRSKLTEKNRVAVPKRFREELGDDLVIAKWYEGCLVMVDKDGWQRLLERLVGNTKFVIEPVRDIDRFVLGSAFDISLDSQGRFVLPDILSEYSQINSEAVFLGLGDRIEVWSDEKWSEVESGAEEKASRAIERIAKR